MLYSQENEGVTILKCEKEASSDVPGEKSSDIEFPTVLSDQEIFLKKKVVKSCETKTLSYQMSWIKSKQWHTYSLTYFIISVFQIISEHETKVYYKDELNLDTKRKQFMGFSKSRWFKPQTAGLSLTPTPPAVFRKMYLLKRE